MHPGQVSMLLYLLAKLRPEAWDAIIPHGPRISVASREYLIAMVLKRFSAELGEDKATHALGGLQKTLVNFAGTKLAAEFDDDNWCGTPWPGKVPIPWPGPGPDPWFSFSEVMLNPQPLPPKEARKQIGGYLLLLSEATSLKEVAKELNSIGMGLVGASS